MEHRLSRRETVNLPVTLHLQQGNIHCLLQDVNADGLFIRGPFSCKHIHTPVKVTLGEEDKDGVSREYQAMVVRMAEGGAGLMFDKTDSEIYTLVNELRHALMRVRRMNRSGVTRRTTSLAVKKEYADA